MHCGEKTVPTRWSPLAIRFAGDDALHLPFIYAMIMSLLGE
jgi:hypothetical protein